MARARNLKPSLFKNELLGVADPLLTLLFESLWCLADREGRLEDRPLRIKAETFPYRDGLDVNVYLTELERLGFICRYEAAGARFIQVLNFAKHQNPHKTERASEIPEMPAKSAGCATTVKAPLGNGSRPADSLVPLTDPLEPQTSTPAADAPEGDVDRRQETLAVVEEVLTAEHARRVPSLEHQAGVVFEHWKLVMDSPKSAFDDKRKATIKKALKMGYAVEDLCAAIDGCRKSPHHMGQNDRGTKYNTIDLIFRGADYIDKFIVIGRSPRVPMLAGASTAGSKFQVAGLDHSSTVAAMERSRVQMQVDLTGPDDDDVSFDLPRRA